MSATIERIKITFKNNITAFIILGFVILYMTGSYLSIVKQNKIEQQQISCIQTCIPVAGVLIQRETNECWCYQDSNTLIKKGE